MKTLFFTTVATPIFSFLFVATIFLIPIFKVQAKVLYEQSKIGVPYDLHLDVGSGSGLYTKFPQYTGELPLFKGGGISYSGTAEWLRVKRISKAPPRTLLGKPLKTNI